MVGRQLPLFSVIVPFWLVCAFAGWRGMLEVWPAILVAGVGFAIPQFLVSNYHGPWLVDVVAAVVSMALVALFLRVWHPKRVWTSTGQREATDGRCTTSAGTCSRTRADAHVWRAWTPWIILSVVVFIVGPAEREGLARLGSP